MNRITYKELTLVLGILVALLVAFSLWAGTPEEAKAPPAGITTGLAFPTPKSLIQAVIDIRN
jgi:hypothetical protein